MNYQYPFYNIISRQTFVSGIIIKEKLATFQLDFCFVLFSSDRKQRNYKVKHSCFLKAFDASLSYQGFILRSYFGIGKLITITAITNGREKETVLIYHIQSTGPGLCKLLIKYSCITNHTMQK